MTRRLLPFVVALACAAPASAGEIVRRVGQLTVVADTELARPGGILVVRLRSSRFLGAIDAIFEGRHAPALQAAGGARALVPIPATTPAGIGLLGIELQARRGPQRIQIEFPIAERAYPPRAQTVPEEKRALLAQPSGLRDGRRLLLAVRTASPTALWSGPFRPPVVVPSVPSFGGRETWVGGSSVEMMLDGGLGEYHRGLDYPVAAGTLVLSPAGGTVVMAATLALSGQTVVIDHGQGLVSALFHLSRIDVREGQALEGRSPVGLAGDSGIAPFPHVHWGVYLHGIAVDPQAVLSLFPNGQ
jgi:murein DD-endopeptidase MepM/ murein hydrolase activator NlpD